MTDLTALCLCYTKEEIGAEKGGKKHLKTFKNHFFAPSGTLSSRN